MSTHTEISPAAERLLEGAFTRRPERLPAREQLADGCIAAAFLVAAVLLAWLAPSDRDLAPGLAAALVAAYVVVGRAEFPTGASYAVPTQIVLVPMLLLLPTPTVPLLVALALVLSTCVDSVRGRVSRDRVLLSVADAWYVLPPALVLIAGGAQTPDWADWPVYVAALGAQVCLESVLFAGRVWACLGEDPRLTIAELRMTRRVDLLLTPVGLVAAFAAADQPYAALLVTPLAGLFTIFAGERTARALETRQVSGAHRSTALLLGDDSEGADVPNGQHTPADAELSDTEG